jgi:hypothetical protein
MLKAMAHLVRPAPERRTSRHNKSRSPQPPAGDELVKAQQHPPPPPPQPAISTRRSSRTTLSLDNGIPNATLQQQTLPKTAPPTRSGSRKRPASEIATDPRPPTKVTVTQPHGDLVRITNGVLRELSIDADDVPSGVSTPDANGTRATLGVPTQTPAGSQDKRSLRSHDGGSRLKSDLATYFANYDDIMAGVPKPPGMWSRSYREACLTCR